ncbi:hypothetical protein [Endozoicomonas arenosclerae]|uniref:hypothetical protein n=1 Tax=Endozoicomonas arenosclerae TaxID=1633495 RepID=UPI000ABCE8C1|nr:hypothetical protein [Endozoicomonas arenosclerae]
MFENLGQWLKPAPQVTARAIPLSALFWPASLSDDADLKFHREKLNYQGKDHSGLPVYHNAQGQPIDVLTLNSNTVMLPNGIGLTWTPEKPPEIGIEGYPDNLDARQVVIYTTPVSETSGPTTLELPASEGELVILWSPEAHRGVPVYYSEWKIPDEVIHKIPERWIEPTDIRKGIGKRWFDPENKGNGIRIDKGNPNHSLPSQQVDHVIVRSSGKVLGRDGLPIVGSIKNNGEHAHIPLSEYISWKKWDSPN